MRRLIATAILVPALIMLLAFGLGARDGGGAGYKVRAVFDNVAFAVPGEDVKIAGAKVGTIKSMDVTADKKAAVVLQIDDSRFAPFKADATCTVRPQSLIGEKFVECEPGSADAQPIDRIDHGDGEGEHLLPLANTSSPVDLDIVNDVLRLPYRERLAIILNEFGTGLAGRGKDLNTVIHRANPALRDTDKVLNTLARENRVLGRLAADSDTVLGPLAREKSRVSDFIVQANTTAEASAERRADIRGSIARLPRFLRETRGLMSDLGGLADQATPVTRDLHHSAPAVSRLIRNLGPFSQAARPAIRSLGRATVRGRPALIRTRPLIRDLGRFGRSARPLTTNLDRLTTSLDKTGGIERAMDYLFFQMTAVNGFDSFGHYLRAALIANTCSIYTTSPISGCNSNFTDTASVSNTKPALARRATGRSSKGSTPPTGSLLQGLIGQPEDPATARQRKKNIARIRRQASQPSPGLKDAGDPMLDYLLGGDR
jgi:phospholipid/cholesterol/gamma-HCH transport system substrate-binding protein